MKIRLLTSLIISACFSHAASAAELTTGGITNQTTATADVMFNQPITLENTLMPVAGLKAGEAVDSNNPTTIATGKLAIKEAGVTARLALKIEDAGESQLIAYAEGHQGEAAYELAYMPLFDNQDENWDTTVASDGSYVISPAVQRQLTYKVVGEGHGDASPKAGRYTISVTAAVYNP